MNDLGSIHYSFIIQNKNIIIHIDFTYTKDIIYMKIYDNY